ncbi:interleukin-6 receptor subunit beta-like [Salvelinus namaycush]|uniref:Interleukin-6 receptor subunit beta-like n=1 Tax=Salvelinus namaycush TaxID=8040 RepID=A0A8U0UJE8_SALNM|nr:interleukin-6 receptor subunit beta-like [Salvelinus namaycush]
MDDRSLALVALYIGLNICTATEFSLSPSQPQCVFIAYSNVTCYWTPGQGSPSDTRFTLQVNITGCDDPVIHQSQLCQTITQTHCSVNVTYLSRCYCIRVLADSPHTTASSPSLCLNAIDAVKLPTPVLSNVSAVRGKPRCLKLQWTTNTSFPVTRKHISNGALLFQVQYSTEEQPEPKTVKVDLRPEREQGLFSASTCLFSASTLYTLMMRYRYNSTLSHWSDWSPTQQQCTEVAAPSTVPQLWRTVQPVGGADMRRVTLLWKSPPRSQVKCSVPWFNISCCTEGSQNALHTWVCNALSVSDTSCHLTLPPERCSCTLSMSNPAGISPPATITISSTTDTAPKALVDVSVTALDDSRLEVRWTALESPSLSSFLVEWWALSETASYTPYWQRLSHNASKIIITEGVWPKLCYKVTVRPEYDAETGEELSVEAYTRQEAPSAGPKPVVQELSSSAVVLQWEPVPLEQRHGFIRYYTLYIQSEEETPEVVVVPGDSLRYQLSGLSGLYRIHMVAHTDAGGSPPGPMLDVVVGGVVLVDTILWCSIPTVLTVLILLNCLQWRQRIKQNLWPTVPDPAHSSLSTWNTETKYTTVVFTGGNLRGENTISNKAPVSPLPQQGAETY